LNFKHSRSSFHFIALIFWVTGHVIYCWKGIEETISTVYYTPHNSKRKERKTFKNYDSVHSSSFCHGSKQPVRPIMSIECGGRVDIHLLWDLSFCKRACGLISFLWVAREVTERHLKSGSIVGGRPHGRADEQTLNFIYNCFFSFYGFVFWNYRACNISLKSIKETFLTVYYMSCDSKKYNKKL